MPNKICPVCSHVKATRLLTVPKAPLFPVCDPGYQGQKLVALEFVSCDQCGHIFNCLDTSDAMRDLVTQDIPWFVQVDPAQLAVIENVVEWIIFIFFITGQEYQIVAIRMNPCRADIPSIFKTDIFN